MAKIERFEDLDSWKLVRELTKLVYQITAAGEFSHDVGLRNQIRRASVSILSNIAEGFERDGDKEFLQFLAVAKGSCGEVRAQLYVALDQRYISDEQFTVASNKTLEASRLISGLMRYLRQSEMRGSKYK
jgi:four helix bundle protein